LTSQPGLTRHNIAAMIRRSALASLLVLLLSAANALAAPTTVSILKSSYSPPSVTVPMGGSVQWKNTTGTKHNVTADSSFLATMFWPSKTIKAHKTSPAVTFPDAGTFTYHDSLHVGFKGIVVVPMSSDAVDISLNSTVTLYLGTVPTGTGGQPVAHYVQASVNGGATWTTIASTQTNSFSWTPKPAGTWLVETRLRAMLSGATSGWSPTITITVEP